MPVIQRRGHGSVVSNGTTMASANALTGTVDGSQALDVTGARAIIIAQINNGAAGTAGIDVLEKSTDGGISWAAENESILALASDSFSGTTLAGAALNAAGVAPTGAALFKAGPYNGPARLRIARGGAGAGGTAWVTGAPSVIGVRIG